METILEIVPPPLFWAESEILSYANQVSKTLKKINLSSFCIPEVVEEDREGVRTIPFSPKMDPYQFFTLLEPTGFTLNPTLYKVSVLMNKKDFEDWIAEMYQAGIRSIVIVGGGTHTKVYPGYTVTEAIRWIKNHYPSMEVGAMTIFSRAREEEKIFDKILSGVDFFYSQIIFEPLSAKLVLSNVKELCLKNQVEFPPIYLSLAVAATKEDINFMKWLGVEFPAAITHYLLSENNLKIAEKAAKINELLASDLIAWKKNRHLPIFFKIEHIIYNNLQLSAELYQSVLNLERH